MKHGVRGGRETASLLLRAAVGGTMIAHGVRHHRTQKGTADWFGSIGFRDPQLQARLSAVTEIGSGTLLIAGAATPLAAAAVVGTMSVAIRSVHLPHGFFITADGVEYVANLAVGSVALAGLGPGRWSVDHLIGTERWSGARTAVLAGVLGLSAAAVQLALFWRRPDRPETPSAVPADAA
jgi:putative oxidoreductase